MNKEPKQRIEIDGDFYILESSIVNKFETEEIDIDIIGSKELIWENDKVCFELGVLTKDDFNKIDENMDPTMEVTYKDGQRINWMTDYWDNGVWLLEVSQGKHLEELKDFSSLEIKAFQKLLSEADKLGWFRYVKNK